MNAVWAVLIAGGLSFWAAVSVLRQREQTGNLDAEIQKRRDEIRKTALLITTHTPCDLGGCGGSKSNHLAAAKLRQLHTTLAVRLSPDGKSDLTLLQALDELIEDIKSNRKGAHKHAQVVSLISTVLSEQEKSAYTTPIIDTLHRLGRWVYNLPEYLTEYDRERKTN